MQTWRPKLKIVPIIVMCAAVATAWVFGSVAHAATNQLYLTPASQTIATGSTFTVSLRVSPATPIDTVNANIGYNASQLSLQSVSCSGSPLTAFPSCPTSGNPVNISSAILGSTISSDSLVATLTFKLTASSGSSSLTLSGDTATAGNSDGATTTGAAVTVAAATCPAGQTGTPPNCTTPPTSSGGSGSGSGGSTSSGGGSSNTGTGGSSTSSGGGTKPHSSTPSTAVSPVTLGAPTILFTQAVFSITSSSPTQVYIQYGISQNALTSQTPVSGFATTHQLTLNPQTLIPGQTYYYVVVSKNQQGVVTQTAVQSFTTKGLTIKVGVFDKNHKPLRNKTVTLHSTAYTAKTDANGFVTFSNITAGTHHLTYTTGGQNYDETISVLNNVQTSGAVQTAPIQNVSVVLPLTQHSSLITAWWPYVLVAIVVVAGVWLYLNRSRLQGDFAHEAVLTSDATIVTSDNAQRPPTPTQIVVNQPNSGTPPPDEDRLANIPEPDKPAPGSTIAPDNNDHEPHDNEGRGL